MSAVPERFRSAFWNVDFASLDLETHGDGIIGRLLEYGDLAAVHWVIETYGLDTIHAFFRAGGHPELRPYTVTFWRAFFEAEDEEWDSRPAWRRNSRGPWIE